MFTPEFSDPEQALHGASRIQPLSRSPLNSRNHCRGAPLWAAGQASSCSSHLGLRCMTSPCGFHSPIKLLEEAFQTTSTPHGTEFYAERRERPLPTLKPYFVTWVLSLPPCAQNLAEPSMKIISSVSDPYPSVTQIQAKGPGRRQIHETLASSSKYKI